MTEERTSGQEQQPASGKEQPAKPARKKDEVESASPFSVVVGEVYDGPLDLLLDLIRKQDIDIYDIPIAKITAQFLSYVERLKQTDVDAAGDFIYTAALLIHIKSRMLLPRSPAEAAEGENEDPRRELVERLLEHERFKNAAQMLRQKQQIEEATWSRPALREFQDEGTEPEIAADTVDLVRVFREILERVKQRPVLNVDDESVTVGQMIDYLRRRLTMEDGPVPLSQMLRNARSERAVICMFLALLELVRLQAILLRQERNFGDILVKKHTAFEQVMNDTLAARDDWR
ncbi:MAG TPA: segregation/condensation protein A [Acidobacteriaceae bacterium]